MTSKTGQGHRITVITTSHAHVRVSCGDVLLAETERPILLLEGSLPQRYYILRDDVRMDLLALTDTTTHCPFKGDATYYAAKVGEHVVGDIAWSYEEPLKGVAAIGGLICFFNEKVDLEVDGEPLARPHTQWS